MKLTFPTLLALTFIAAPLASAATSDSPASAGTPASPPLTAAVTLADPVIARGQGFEIKQHEMDQVLATAKAQNPTEVLPADAEYHIITQLIEIQLVLQKANDAEKAVGKKEADDRLAAIKKGMTPAEFSGRLKATLMTEDDLRLKVFQDAAAQAALTRLLGIKVTDADAQKWFDDHPGAYDQPEAARIRELVLLTTSDFTTSAAPKLPAAIIQAKHQQILDLHKRILAGEDFAVLAKQYNEDPVSKGNGDVLAFTKNQMEFGDLAFSMKPNQISDVLTNDEGFRIFQLIEIIPPKKAGFADLDDRLKAMLIGRDKRTLAPPFIKQLWNDAKVEILDPKLKQLMAAAEAQAAEDAKMRAAYEARQAAAEKAAANTSSPKP